MKSAIRFGLPLPRGVTLRVIAALVSLAVLLGMSIAMPATATAGQTTVAGEGWSATIEVADLEWDDCYVCRELEILVDLEGATIVGWEVWMDITSPVAVEPTRSFYVNGDEPGEWLIEDVTLCNSDDPPGEYSVVGEVSVWLGDVDPAAVVPFETSFNVLPMPSETEIYFHESEDGLTTFYAVVWPPDPLKIHCSQMPGEMVLERLVGGSWTFVRQFWYTGPGSGYFYATVGGSVTGGEWPGGTTVRAVYHGNNAVAPSVSGPYTLPTPPPPPAPPAKVAPSAPLNPAAVPGDASVLVSWSAPATPGSSPVTGYKVTAAPGGASCSTAGLSCTVTGLANRQQYTFTVVAMSAAGQSGPTTVGPVTPKPFVKIKVKAKKKASVLYIDIDPNLKKKRYWRFRIQKQASDGSWITLKKIYKSAGSKERRTINKKKGTYRVVVLAKHGYQQTVSSTTVTLRK